MPMRCAVKIIPNDTSCSNSCQWLCHSSAWHTEMRQQSATWDNLGFSPSTSLEASWLPHARCNLFSHRRARAHTHSHTSAQTHATHTHTHTHAHAHQIWHLACVARPKRACVGETNMRMRTRGCDLMLWLLGQYLFFNDGTSTRLL